MKITLYHGSTLSIEHPLAKVGRADLDFGRVFLSNLTTLTRRTVGCPRTTITGKYYCMD